MRPGSLVMRLPDSELSTVQTLLYGTVEGAIGVVASLPRPLFEFLERLQAAMRKVVQGVGGLSHADWRAYRSERCVAEAAGFVDGDLLEAFLDLPAPRMAQVAELMGGGATVDEIGRVMEELARLH